MAATATTFKSANAAIFLLFQVALCIIYWACTQYVENPAVSPVNPNLPPSENGTWNQVYYLYYSHVIAFTIIGFPLLFTYSHSGSVATAFTSVFLAGGVLQWGILLADFWKRVSTDDWDNAPILDSSSILNGCYATITVITSYSIYAPYVTFSQALWLSAIEVIVWGLNLFVNVYANNCAEWEINVWVFGFGAVYGLGALLVLKKNAALDVVQQRAKSTYAHQIITLFGAAVVLVNFPSVNVPMHRMYNQRDVIVGTSIAVGAGIVTAFSLSVISNQAKWCVASIRNAAVASGVGIGCSLAATQGPDVAAAVGVGSAAFAFFLTPVGNKLGDVSGSFAATFGGYFVGGIGNMISMAIVKHDATYHGNSFVGTFGHGYATGNQVAGFFITFGIAIGSGIVAAVFFNLKIFATKGTEAALVDSEDVVLEAPVKEVPVPAPAPVVAPAPIVAPVVAPKPVVVAPPKPVVTRTIFSGFNTQQVVDFLRAENLPSAASKVSLNDIVGQDIMESELENLVTFFGAADGKAIWDIIGAMAP